MVVKSLKINGVVNPVGYLFDELVCSWKVEEALSKRQTGAKIEVSDDDFKTVLYTKEGVELSSIGEKLDIKLKPYTKYTYRVTVEGDSNESATSELAYFETAKMNEKWDADWIGLQEGDDFHPVFSQEFNVSKIIKKASLYISGLGLYVAYINGEKVGNELLTPYFDDYDLGIQYQTYTLEGLSRGNNKVDIKLGNGWYKGRLGYDGEKEFYGDKFALIAEIHIEYEDGTKEKVITGDHWSYSGSEIEASDIYDGEIINHLLWEGKDNSPKKPLIMNISKDLLKERLSLPVIVKEYIDVKEVIKTPAGETVLDLGQNFSGFVEFSADFVKGTKITLDHGEVLQDGNFYNDNYRTAKVQLVYTSDGRKETVRPSFTFFGFRYVRVTGWPGEVKAEDFRGCVTYSDIERTGYIKTSNEKVNRLYENTVWGLKSNFVDIPTDCPQRDERLGWTGDIQVFAPTACYHMETKAFFKKYLDDIRKVQVKIGGAVPNYVPSFGHFDSTSIWGDVATFVPENVYEFYGDKELLNIQYPLMKDWVDHLISENQKQGGRHIIDYGFQFGDWLAQDGSTDQSFKGGTDDYYIASVYFHASVIKVAKAAEVLGLSEEAAKYRDYADKVKEGIFKEFFTPNGRLSIDTQTAYIISLRFGIFMDKERILKGLKTRIIKDCYKIKGGFVGAPVMCQVLAENGMAELAYQFMLNEKYPGWINCVNLGATTIWERWNSILQDGSISGTGMNSLNHYAYGTVAEFMYKNIAGIKSEEIGFKKVIFEPIVDGRLKSVQCEYDSASGKYISEWVVNNDGTVSVKFEVPFNCTATIKLPNYNGEVINMEAGKFELTYKPERDYRTIFGENTKIGDFAENEEVLEIFKDRLPIAYGMIMGRNDEDLSRTLGELKYMFFMGFVPEVVEGVIKDLEKIMLKEYR